MAATVNIKEYNGSDTASPLDTTAGITTSHYGYSSDSSADTANIAAATTHPIPPGNNSYEKWQTLNITGGTYSTIDTIRIYRSSTRSPSLPANTSHKVNADVSPLTNDTAYDTATTAASVEADQDMPDSDPAAASITGSFSNDATGESTFFVHQVQTTASPETVDGYPTAQLTYVWKEVA